MTLFDFHFTSGQVTISLQLPAHRRTCYDAALLEPVIPNHPPGNFPIGRHDPRFLAIAGQLVDVSHRFHARGWAAATSGNFSWRLGADSFAITASGRDKGRLTASDLVIVGLEWTRSAEDSPTNSQPVTSVSMVAAREVTTMPSTKSA